VQDCLDALQRAQETLTPAQLQEATGHDCGAKSQLVEHLVQNPKVGASGGTFRFKVIFLSFVSPHLIQQSNPSEHLPAILEVGASGGTFWFKVNVLSRVSPYLIQQSFPSNKPVTGGV
jgi:hypothetical protein